MTSPTTTTVQMSKVFSPQICTASSPPAFPACNATVLHDAATPLGTRCSAGYGSEVLLEQAGVELEVSTKCDDLNIHCGDLKNLRTGAQSLGPMLLVRPT
jgi:hypothetical protein